MEQDYTGDVALHSPGHQWSSWRSGVMRQMGFVLFIFKEMNIFDIEGERKEQEKLE